MEDIFLKISIYELIAFWNRIFNEKIVFFF